MCNPFGGGSQDSTSTVVNQLPAYVEQGGEDLFNRALALSENPYDPYNAARIAPLTANQTGAINLAQSTYGNYQPYLDAASGLASGAGAFGDYATAMGDYAAGFGDLASSQASSAVDQADWVSGIADIGAQQGFEVPQRAWDVTSPYDRDIAARYMNPYAENVIDISADKMWERYGQRLNELGGEAVAQGALGGTRHGIESAELGESTIEDIGNTYLTGLANAYDTAYNQYSGDRNARLAAINTGLAGTNTGLAAGQLGLGAGQLDLGAGQLNLGAGQLGLGAGQLGLGAGQLDVGAATALGNLGQLETALSTQGLNNLLGTGGLERSVNQQSLSTAYQDFLNEQNWPYQQLNFASGILSGTPYSTTRTTDAEGPGPDTFGQLLGLGGTLGGAYLLGGGQFSNPFASSPGRNFVGVTSDRRVKKNIRKVGKLDNELPVYAFEYKAGGPPQIGLMAQDVEQVKPEAVGAFKGIKMVDYDLATAA